MTTLVGSTLSEEQEVKKPDCSLITIEQPEPAEEVIELETAAAAPHENDVAGDDENKVDTAEAISNPDKMLRGTHIEMIPAKSDQAALNRAAGLIYSVIEAGVRAVVGGGGGYGAIKQATAEVDEERDDEDALDTTEGILKLPELWERYMCDPDRVPSEQDLQAILDMEYEAIGAASHVFQTTEKALQRPYGWGAGVEGMFRSLETVDSAIDTAGSIIRVVKDPRAKLTAKATERLSCAAMKIMKQAVFAGKAAAGAAVYYDEKNKDTCERVIERAMETVERARKATAKALLTPYPQ